MSENAFKPGDVVRLKSGGPALTVAATVESHCKVAWFNAAGQLDYSEIPAGLLERAVEVVGPGIPRSIPSARLNPRLRKSPPGEDLPADAPLAVVSAGVDPSHQTDHCDHCKIPLFAPEAAVQTCDLHGPLTLCVVCYRKAGNSVR